MTRSRKFTFRVLLLILLLCLIGLAACGDDDDDDNNDTAVDDDDDNDNDDDNDDDNNDNDNDDDDNNDDDNDDDDTPALDLDWIKFDGTPAPDSAIMAAMAYDEIYQQVVLFSGGTGLNRDTWLWDGSAWSKADPSKSPSARIGHGMVYDSKSHQVVLFCGIGLLLYPNDTWTWDGADWTKIDTNHTPPGRANFGMAYDRLRERTVIFGGCTGNPCATPLDDTWEFDGVDWQQATPATIPDPRISPYMFYDRVMEKTILFGGYGGGEKSDTWAYDGQDWELLLDGSTDSPTPRSAGAAAYDPVRQRGLIFGGEGGYMTFLDETWQWDQAGWRLVETDTAPRKRNQTCGAFHTQADQFVIFAGWFSTEFIPVIFKDTWLLEEKP
ncbi:MAG: hypothetical protein P9L99_00435 [Candidatus Lernaella stagnicola]|nr:hypothetical protein [Candidatus Lernaella stagnicola]